MKRNYSYITLVFSCLALYREDLIDSARLLEYLGSCWASSLVVLASPGLKAICAISYFGVKIPLKMKVLSSSFGFDELSHCRRWGMSVICAQIAGLYAEKLTTQNLSSLGMH